MGLGCRVKRLAADGGVLLHDVELIRIQPARFEQDVIANPHLADVMQWARQIHHLNEVAVHVITEHGPRGEFLGQDAAVLSHPLQVHAGFRVSAFG